MRKILIEIKDNTFIIKEKIKLSSEYKNIINTNVISCNELVFSDEYILNNKKIVATPIFDTSRPQSKVEPCFFYIFTCVVSRSVL